MAQTWQKHKNPKGGLTQKAVSVYRKENPGSKLKTGVDGAANTPEKLRRKGSFLARFYGRSKLPPLKKPNGEPTRLALANNAWGGSTVKTVAQARSLAARGRKMLARYKKTKK